MKRAAVIMITLSIYGKGINDKYHDDKDMLDIESGRDELIRLFEH